jgi:hypothetical protein
MRIATLKRFSLLLLTTLCGCAAWKAGISDPNIVSHAIATAQPYKQVADAVYPHAGIVVGAILIPIMILIDGWHKEKK